MSHADHPVLVIDLRREPGRYFRAAPSALQRIENNLSIANLDFADFADFAEAAEATTDKILRELAQARDRRSAVPRAVDYSR
ncbi:MAG: hypothetical protein M3Z65_04800 [Chloroflexota bacterium]|nr:hypothetical protein [Chloroflexota bacterium]